MESTIEGKENFKEVMFFLLRIWLGYAMISNGKFLFDKGNLDFFLDWFGNRLHFPKPLLMFYLAKGSEFFGGILICLGLFTRIAGFFVAFTMLVATLTANIHQIYSGDGTITISFLLFAVFFIFIGAGAWSLDNLIFDRWLKKKYLHIRNEKLVVIFSFTVRIWLGSILLFNIFHTNNNDPVYILLNWIFAGHSIVWVSKIIEAICCLSILTGFFSKFSSVFLSILMLVVITFSNIKLFDSGLANVYASKIFWLSCLIFFSSYDFTPKYFFTKWKTNISK